MDRLCLRAFPLLLFSTELPGCIDDAGRAVLDFVAGQFEFAMLAFQRFQNLFIVAFGTGHEDIVAGLDGGSAVSWPAQ